MSTQPHPINVPATRALVAAFILLVGFGALALSSAVYPRSGSMQVPSPDDVSMPMFLD